MNRIVLPTPHKKRADSRLVRRVLISVIVLAVFLLTARMIMLLFPYMNLPNVTTADLDALVLDDYDHLMFVAHPDDELLWGGKHLLEDNWFVVCITNGNNQTRRGEFESVLRETGDKGLILSYPDKIGSRRSGWKLWRDDIEADIATVLRYKDWKTVVSHNEKGEYGHQHHIMTHESVWKEYQQTGSSGSLYWFGRYYVNDRIPYDLQEMDKESYLEKRRLARLYVSQRGTFRKLYHMLPYEYWTQER